MLEAGTGLEKTAVVEGQPFVVVGVPAFNEEKTIAKVVIEGQKYADKVIVYDDGFNDLTAEIAENSMKQAGTAALSTKISANRS